MSQSSRTTFSRIGFRWWVVLVIAMASACLSAQSTACASYPDESCASDRIDAPGGSLAAKSEATAFNAYSEATPHVPAEAALPAAPLPEAPKQNNFLPDPSDAVALAALPPVTPQKINWKAATLESFSFTMFNHMWRAAFDPSLRYQLAHKPFFHDWFASYAGYNLHRWGDGDDFLVNYVGHPLQGAVTSRIYLQNDPRSFVPISKNRNYWVPLGQSMIWSALWQVEWKVGPFSETSFGNSGGWLYVPDCGTDLSCLNNPKYPKPPTNNTGLTDWVSTPLIGGAWVLAEDTLDRYVVVPIARNHRILGGRVLRACLEPSRDFAALFAGKLVWQLPQYENNYYVKQRPLPTAIGDPNETPLLRREVGTQYSTISLPVLTKECPRGCRQNLSGIGFNLGYNITRGFSYDSNVNFMPSQNGTTAMMQGQFGVKMGEHWERWGLFGKVRPGFIYYENAWPGGGSTTPTSLTRFTWDFGGVVEVYTHRNGTLRVDAGTTMVRYLSDHPDPKMSALGDLRSNQYIVTQGNFQLSTAYVYRF